MTMGELSQLHEGSLCQKTLYGSATGLTNIAWDHDVMTACLCDSSWAVGVFEGQTQLSEYLGPTVLKCQPSETIRSPQMMRQCAKAKINWRQEPAHLPRHPPTMVIMATFVISTVPIGVYVIILVACVPCFRGVLGDNCGNRLGPEAC